MSARRAIEIPAIVALRIVRGAGEDVRAARPAAGQMVGWPEVALLAALGIATVPVAAPVRVAAHDRIGTAAARRDATPVYLRPNGPMLAALLASPAVAVTALAVGDEFDAVVRALALASG